MFRRPIDKMRAGAAREKCSTVGLNRRLLAALLVLAAPVAASAWAVSAPGAAGDGTVALDCNDPCTVPATIVERPEARDQGGSTSR